MDSPVLLLLLEANLISEVSVFHLQDEIPELQEFFLVNVTSAVLITTFGTVPQLGKKAALSDLNGAETPI